jgi:hypothetical protein
MEVRTSAGYLTYLLGDIRKGETVPARFQRPYVWKKPDVEAFWTSIIKGYPLGSFLLWKPKEPCKGRDSLGPIKIAACDKPSLILDGQNRLVTLAWSISDPDEYYHCDLPGYDVFKEEILTLDPYEKNVRFMKKSEVHGMMMPVHYLTNNANVFYRKNWKSDEDDAAIDWLEQAGYKLRESKIVITTILDASPEEAKEAFLHIARAGVPMSEGDFMAILDQDTRSE